MSSPVPDTGSLDGDLRGFVEGTVDFFDRPLVREAWLGCVAELRTDGALADVHDRFLKPAADGFRRRLADAAARGEARTDVDAQTVLDLLLGACIAGLIVPGRRPSKARRVDAIAGVVLRGLSPEPTAT